MNASRHAAQTPSLTVTPERALVDEPVRILLSGCAPRQAVTLRARTLDGARKEWVSYATFVADEHGHVDVGAQKPRAGTYDDVDPMGLFWSMTLTDPKERAFFVKTKATPLTVTIAADVDGRDVACARVERLFAAPGITRTPVEEEGLVGALFHPAVAAGASPYPAVIVLGGSDGGLREHAAALLASHGYAALALAYFGVEDVPQDLINIPLEYFETATHWLQRQSAARRDKLAVIGLSRGGELALLLGATFPQVKAVVAGAPSGIMYGGVRRNGRPVAQPAWIYHGEALPYLASKLSFGDVVSFFSKWMTHRPVANRPGFLTTLKDRAAVERAAIPVENIQGPILLVAGQDDQLWPSALFAKMVMDRLAVHNHPYPDQHLRYKGAGHFVCFPYGLPSLPPMVTLSPAAGVLLTFGGSAKANAHAATDSWPRILTFLAEM